jgi:SSS family solute:Na+ symporter
MITAGSVVMLFSVVTGIIGMYAFSINPHLPDAQADQTFPWLVVNVLPPVLAAIVVVAATAAILSCANSNATAVGTYFVRHIFPLAVRRYPQNPVTVARWVLVAAFIISTAFALHTTSIVSFVVKFLPITMSGLAVIILIGRFWKRANWQGALAALIATPTVSLAVLLIPFLTKFWGYPAIPAVFVGGLTQIVVSLITPRPQTDFAEIAQKLMLERQAIENDLVIPPGSTEPAGNVESTAAA